MAINYAAQFAPKVAETFENESLTESACGRDFQFTGTKTLKVMTVDTVPLGDYSRSGVNRYGQPVELGDAYQEMVMGDDKAFTMTIDKGNNSDQMNLKGAAEAMKREVAQVVVPYIDKYRIQKWSENAGTVVTVNLQSADLDFLKEVFNMGTAMDNAGVPMSNRTIFIPNRIYKLLALSDKLLGVEKLGENALAKGIVGQIDGMVVKRVPDDYMPQGVQMLAKWKNASVDPVKLQEGKIHKDPPGISGNLLEGRIYQDAFVLGAKAAGVCVAVDYQRCVNVPVISPNTVTLMTTLLIDEGAKAAYTLDGTDPRYSATRIEYTEPFPTPSAGSVIRAVAWDTDKPYILGISERTI